MSISDRYRELVADVKRFCDEIVETMGEEASGVREVRKATEGLAELQETVGDIPRIRLEAELTPVLIRAHNQLDRARLLFEEQDEEDFAAEAWELQQKIYRLLNDL